MYEWNTKQDTIKTERGEISKQPVSDLVSFILFLNIVSYHDLICIIIISVFVNQYQQNFHYCHHHMYFVTFYLCLYNFYFHFQQSCCMYKYMSTYLDEWSGYGSKQR